MIYLDNAATTPIHEDVLKEMLPYFDERYGNPSSLHKLGREANNALLLARKRIKDSINAREHKIVFTSGATEANNLALKGVMHASKKKHLIVSSIEHESILEPAKSLEREGYKVSYIPVDKYARIDLDKLEGMIDNDTALISVMLVNNEVGTIEPLDDVIELAHKHGIMVHSDIVQATGKMKVDVSKLDLVTLSAHKMYGPKGVGALCISEGVKIIPIIDGGGHEYNLRSGTQNVPAIVGIGKAFEISKIFDYNKVKELRDILINRLLEIPNARLNGHPTHRVANNIHITFLGVNGEDLIIKLSEKGVAASTGSACSVNKQKASHVLKAMNFSYEEITGSLRLTLGIQNTREEIEKAGEIISDTVKELRSLSPYASKYLT
ncbi:MAG: cysteine desulfurase NifS [Candidatus Nitrosocaldaceae archaeon]|nr:MAG: cysteine desulfurase NifS [Candidatus Nitrosocaldaceae archaeon]